MFKVAILGCPNVGKSTLFNRLIRKHMAVIHDAPGVTRDYNEGFCQIGDKTIIVVDSPGWGHTDEFSTQVQENIMHTVHNADLIILLVEPDISQNENNFSIWIHRNTNSPVILAINKCETRQYNADGADLGWSDTISISAQHCIGLNRLRDKIGTYIIEETSSTTPNNGIKISIVGRPNVGKSTLINHLLREHRVITSPIAGTTRDAIEIHWQYKDQQVVLIDTAGMRRRAKVNERIESLSVGASIYSIRQADVVVLIADSTRGFERQDLSIANVIIDEGKALVIAINKCDLSTQDDLSHIKYCCLHHLPEDTTVINISALKNNSCNKIIDACLQNHTTSKQIFSTSRLNRWLSKVIKKHEPPLSSRNTPLRLKFISQIGINPFTFKIVVNLPEDLTKSYIRYLVNDIRKTFNLQGSPVKIVLEKNYNPYVQRALKA